MKWRNVKKIDGHAHLYQNQSIDTLIQQMDEYHIEKTIILPTNSPRSFFSDIRKTNEYLAEIVNKHPNRFIAFSDVIIKDAMSMYEAANELEYGVKELGLKGLKIHPCNLNLPADDYRLIPVLRKAAELNVPVIYHSFPWRVGFSDLSEPNKINKMIKVFPDITFILSHMGGVKFMDVIRSGGMVDISMGLFEVVDVYGIEIANKLLRKIGIDRLIFASDYPIGQYERYISILDQMDFSDEEIKKIAYDNINKILFK